jgi:hypothetical protein
LVFLFSVVFGEKPNYGNLSRRYPHRKWENIATQVAEIQRQTSSSTREALEKKYGVRYTELSRLEYYDGVQFTVIDPMHNLFLGTAKTMLKDVWPRTDNLSSGDLDQIQDCVDLTNTPAEIGLIPRKIASCFSSFTAAQLKNWTLYFSAFCMKGHLRAKSYKCWMLFVEACYYLCRPVITAEELGTGHGKLMAFCADFEALYGSSSCFPNLHMHEHILESVLDYDPMYGFWLFSFERMNGVLGSYRTNQRSVEAQLFRRI